MRFIYGDLEFVDPVETFEVRSVQQLKDVFDHMEQNRELGFYAGFVKYGNLNENPAKHSGEDIAFFALFKKAEEFSPPSVKYKKFAPSIKGFVSLEDYTYKIQKIKDLISQGVVYQLNFTQELRVYSLAPSFDIFCQLLEKQNTKYRSYIQTESKEIISLSPELFFEITDNKIRVKPMKGTIARGETQLLDRKNIEFLKNDFKNMSENVMIVDLMRNDLNKVASNVKAERLFEIETHPTLHQMTSDISAEMKSSLFDTFMSIFPSGSVTGAPKHSVMSEISKLESHSRDVYCGAIGVIGPKKIRFSVPIRTLIKNIDDEYYRYGVGSGVVWDSDPTEEYKEVKLKTRILEGDFKLFETMRVKGNVARFRKLHIERLKKSAMHFGFKWNHNVEKQTPKYKDCVWKITLSRNGEIGSEYRQLPAYSIKEVSISKSIVDPNNDFLYHKTDYRVHYASTAEKIKNGLVFDEIHINNRGELTEGSRTNIVLNTKKGLYTPASSCGLLNGITRQIMLRRGICKEAILTIEDLKSATEVFCINSVMGCTKVEIKI